MKRAGLLKPLTDPDELTRKAWLDLDGVTDEWIKGLKVQTVQGGGRPPLMAPGMFAALCEGRQLNYGCCGVD
jgi:NitT/TauT family transport system substrate-binding protein